MSGETPEFLILDQLAANEPIIMYSIRFPGHKGSLIMLP
jgi:hypothetical protein